MKNLQKAINSLENNSNFFDSNYTLEELLKYQNESIREINDQLAKRLSIHLQALSSLICQTLLNFNHFSKLMDADQNDQKLFFERFNLKEKDYSVEELDDKFTNEDGKNALKKALYQEYENLDRSIFVDPDALNALKEIQFIIVRQKDIVIDLESLLKEIKESKVLMEYFGFIATRSMW